MGFLDSYPQPGNVYRHYKGNTYMTVAVAQHTEEHTVLVIYTRYSNTLRGRLKCRLLAYVLKNTIVWARPIRMFTDSETPNRVKRFTKLKKGT